MDLLSQIVARAKSNKQRIVLPEAEEERTLCAADKALADELADIILIGNPAKVAALAKEKGLTNIGYDYRGGSQARQEPLVSGMYDYQDRGCRWSDFWCFVNYWRHTASCPADYQVSAWYHLCKWWSAAYL